MSISNLCYSKILSVMCVFFNYESCTLLRRQIYMDRRPTVCVSVGLSFKLIWNFYKEYILVHRAIPKSLRFEC